MNKKYSGKRIEKAGTILAGDTALEEAERSGQMDVLSYWRYCHERPLNEAFSVIQSVVVEFDREAIFARRLKRYNSIISKLQRFEKMSLKNMQDIGGCRAIVTNEKKLQQVVRRLRKMGEFRNANGKFRSKNYLKNPKEDGYRSYHIVGRFEDELGETKSIEVQIRTLIQHYWATALEIVDIFTGQALKSNQGEEQWRIFFREVSEQFAVMDKIHLFNALSDQEQYLEYSKGVRKSEDLMLSCSEIQKISKNLDVKTKLQAYAGSLQVINTKITIGEEVGFVLLHMDINKSTVTVTSFEENKASEAEEKYIAAEKQYAGSQNDVIALVSTTNIGDIKEAYPNFFADSSLFAKHLGYIENIQIQKGFFEKLIESTPNMQ